MVVTVVIIFIFFIILSLLYLLAWLYNPDSNILGGAILMLLTLIILLTLFILSARNRRAENKTETGFLDRFPTSAQIIFYS